jgi:putative hydroxymethylpyrimidine transport system substrate-binding protein
MRRAIIIVLAAAVLLAGCGASQVGRSERTATVVLDFTPNAVHAGIYSALARGFDRQQGLRLRVIAPSASTDSIKLLVSGRVQFAIVDIHDLAIARARGASIVGVMALVQRPLASLIASPQIRNPRQLSGETVGVTGAPSDTAVLNSILTGGGASRGSVRTIEIGFNAVAALLSHRVAAATAFWNDEGVALERRRPGFHIFRVEDYNAPSYPELILCATRTTVRRDPDLARRVVRTLIRGYELTVRDRRGSERDLLQHVPGLDPRLVGAELAALEPAFQTASQRIGVLDQPTLRAWARWEVGFGIVKHLPDVRRTFDPAFAGSR